MNKTFKHVKKMDGFRGNADLYELSHPVTFFSWKEDGDVNTKFVVASSIDNEIGTETYLFPSNESGEILSFSELEGSSRGIVSHEYVLNGAGYTKE